MDEIKQACNDYMEFFRSDEFHPDKMDDYQNDIFEKAIQHFHGTGVFGEINRIMD